MSGGITHIIHPELYQGYPYQPEEVAQQKDEYDLEKLEQVLLDRDSAHFREAGGTPFATDAMPKALPFTADTMLMEDILEGKDVFAPTLEATQTLKKSFVLSNRTKEKSQLKN